MSDIKNKILKTIEQFAEVAKNKGYEFPNCVVDFSLTGTTAGYAFRRVAKMRFNLALAERNEQAFLSDTVPHEMAHILQFKHYPNSKPHGGEWKYFCRVLTGAEMPRCHDYDVTGIKRTRNVKKYAISCGCMQHVVSQTIINRIKSGRIYTCVLCKGVIK